MTEYRFDTSNVQNTYKGKSNENSIIALNTERYLGYPIHTSSLDNDARLSAERVFGPQLINGYVQESFWEKAPLVCKTTYRYTDKGYEPMERIENRYSTAGGTQINTGLYVEGLTRNVKANFLHEVYESNDDFN